MRKLTGGMAPALIWKAVIEAAEAGMPATALDRSPGPPAGEEPEQVAVTAYSDDPMQGSTFVTPTAPRTPEMVVTAATPVIPPAPSGEETSLAAPQTPQAPAEDWVITRVPYQAYARAAPTIEPPAQVPETSSRADADAYYRYRRELDYWRMRREAMRPIPDEDRVYRGEYRRQPEEYLPFPAPRERAERY
jgi:hypothetical protein